MNRMTRTVCVGTVAVSLTQKEFSLLEYLLLAAGRCVPRRELLQEVWKLPSDASTNVVDVYINYLRRKLTVHGGTDPIQTVRGEGYFIAPPRHGATIAMEVSVDLRRTA